VEDQEAGLLEDLALQEEVTQGQEIDHLREMQGKLPLHQTDQDLLSDVIPDHREDQAIQDHQEEMIQDHQEEMIPDHQEEPIQDHQNDQETLDPQDDQKVQKIEKVLKERNQKVLPKSISFVITQNL